MYKIKLADGTLIENLQLNGNNFISQALIGDTIFEDNLSTVTVYENDTETIYENMKLIQNKQYGDEYWFILAKETKEEVEKKELKNRLDATEMALIELMMEG